VRRARRADGTDCRPRARPRVPAWLALLCLAGCAINPRFDLAETVDGAQPRQLQAVPFFAQTQFQCGPSALAGVLGASGVQTSPEALSPQVYLPERRGSLQVELLAAARRAGRVAYVIEDEPEVLFAQVESGRPVLVLQNLGTRNVPVWHYAVLVGFDPDANKVYLNSGRDQGLSQDARKFLRTWDWAGRWAMVALRPGDLPARAERQNYAEAVAVFERVAGVGDAERAWRAAIAHWPDDSRPWLALGNLAHAGDDRETAVQRYRAGLQRAPDDAVLTNNLASTLGEMGCSRTAESLLNPVWATLPEDSPWRPALAGTVAELSNRPGADPERCARLLHP